MVFCLTNRRMFQTLLHPRQATLLAHGLQTAGKPVVLQAEEEQQMIHIKLQPHLNLRCLPRMFTTARAELLARLIYIHRKQLKTATTLASFQAANGSATFSNNFTTGKFTMAGANGYIGGFVGRPYSNLASNSNIKFVYCAAVFTTATSGSGSIANSGAFWSGYNSNQMVVQNSYSLFNNSLNLSSTTSGMDGNFGYHSSFHNGVPIPLGIYATTEFFTQTGILSYLQNKF